MKLIRISVAHQYCVYIYVQEALGGLKDMCEAHCEGVRAAAGGMQSLIGDVRASLAGLPQQLALMCANIPMSRCASKYLYIGISVRLRTTRSRKTCMFLQACKYICPAVPVAPCPFIS